ncbi:phage major tail tube protein [Terrarubrum flagellatum]|uniref:phage major tail tube protein n=1 Tax=Terrirubrum flagellatum TaxID=2895980 RepID=UPI003144E9E1
MADIFEMDLANIFVGDPDPKKSLHTSLKSVKLPDLKLMSKEHKPAGAAGSVNFRMNSIDALKFTFKCAGFTPDLSAKFGIGVGLNEPYFMLGNVRNLRTGEQFPGRAVVRGVITAISPSEFTAGDGIEHDYEIDEVTHYEFLLNNQEIYYFDFWEGPAGVRINGVSVMQQAARNIGIV